MTSISDRSSEQHFTTRRGFVAACGFGIVGLYGLWAAPPPPPARGSWDPPRKGTGAAP